MLEAAVLALVGVDRASLSTGLDKEEEVNEDDNLVFLFIIIIVFFNPPLRGLLNLLLMVLGRAPPPAAAVVEDDGQGIRNTFGAHFKLFPIKLSFAARIAGAVTLYLRHIQRNESLGSTV